MKKLIALIMAILMFASLGTAFAEGEQEITRELYEGTNGTTVRLAFNGVEFDPTALGIVLQEFVDETGYSVEIMYVPTTGGWGGYFNKLQTMIASGDVPDLIRIAIEGFHIFQSRGLIEPIDKYFDTFPEQLTVLDMTEAAINSPEAVEVFQFLQDLIYKYEVAPRPLRSGQPRPNLPREGSCSNGGKDARLPSSIQPA